MKIKIIGALLLVTALSIVLFVIYENSQRKHIPIVYSPQNMLDSLWETYKKDYWEAETGRTIDRQRDNVTTSEGQSYSLLRAVWQDDKQTFDKAWGWSREQLQREDKLFSWLWGEKTDGTYGILTDENGQNSAADADSDIATALILAYSRWKDPEYLKAAEDIAEAIWEHEVVEISGRPYLASNNQEKLSSQSFVVINPSYFSPYAYRLFKIIDPGHDWDGVIATSYEILDKISVSPLDKTDSIVLPPDWVTIDRSTAGITIAQQEGHTTNFSYDALRVPWRIAMDYNWYNSGQAKDLLVKFSFLKDQWESQRVLYAAYSHDGNIISKIEAPAMYGGTIGYFGATDPELAEEVYKLKLQTLYNPDSQTWRKPLSYYDDNWAWFGLALYHGHLRNLATDLEKVNLSAK
jgi:endoglucanase